MEVSSNGINWKQLIWTTWIDLIGIIIRMESLSDGIQMDWMGFGNIVKWNQLGAIDSNESSIKERMESTHLLDE